MKMSEFDGAVAIVTGGASGLGAATADPHAAASALRARQPLGRLVSAAEVAHAIAYLASRLASSTTGTLLSVDGGMHGIRVS
jgi:NAD(P)-dependent dehydrogenase (short-subunit alcohol dehydrogenase family)